MKSSCKSKVSIEASGLSGSAYLFSEQAEINRIIRRKEW